MRQCTSAVQASLSCTVNADLTCTVLMQDGGPRTLQERDHRVSEGVPDESPARVHRPRHHTQE